MCQEVTLSTKDLSSGSGNDADRRVASAIVNQLATRIGQDRFELWFDDPQCIRFSTTEPWQKCISVSAENQFALQRLQNTFGHDIRHVVDRVCGSSCQVDFCVGLSNEAVDVPNEVESRDQPESVATSLPQSHDSPPVVNKSGGDSSLPGDANVQNNNGLAQSSQPSKPLERRSRNLSSFWFGSENALAKAGVDQLLNSPVSSLPFLFTVQRDVVKLI